MAYRKTEDTLGQFIDDFCLVQEGIDVKAGDFYRAYSDWCAENNIKAMTGTTFGTKMTKRYPKIKKRDGAYYLGIGLLSLQVAVL